VSGARIRAEAARAVEAVAGDGRSLDAALAQGETRLPPSERPLLRLLCYGALRNHWRLRAWIDALLDKPLKRKDSVIASLLAVGLFQLTDSRVPDHAAVTLTVDAARLLRRPKYAGLINAVLRNFRRSSLEQREFEDDEARFNHPAWLIARLKRDWPDQWRQILEANNARAPMWLRVNRSRTSTAAWLARLAEADATPAAGSTLAGFDAAVRLAEPRPASELPGFGEGLVSVQDAAAQLAAPWLLADGGSRILDACAAPGGKTAHLLELSGPAAALTAVDKSPERLELISDNLKRLGLAATLGVADASKPDDWWDGVPFDRILLDAPCSATGVIRRHPDIKLLRRESDIAAFTALQRALLDALWPLLQPGGRLLYVTCSVLCEENDAVVGAFLEACPTAAERQMLPDYNIRALMHRKSIGFQTLPGEAGLDGFYYACLEKTRDDS
jgi:16S rRNA (cytosine967-C5)-methyltransferase